MKGFNLLLAGADRRAGNLIEVLVRDVCFTQSVVECTRTGRVDDFIRLARDREFDLVVLAPAHLLPAPGQPGGSRCFQEVLRGLRSVRGRRQIPIVAVNTLPEQQESLLEAGADAVVGVPINYDQLKSEVRRVLRIPEPVAETVVEEQPKVSFLGLLLRGFQRSKPA
jgi:DNA-binding response OmpR family regulator